MNSLRACLKIPRGPVFGQRDGWRGATRENIPRGSSTAEQQSQTALRPKTLRAAGLLPVPGVGSFLTARCGDARNSPPWPPPKSLAAGPVVILRPALRVFYGCVSGGILITSACIENNNFLHNALAAFAEVSFQIPGMAYDRPMRSIDAVGNWISPGIFLIELIKFP